MVIRIEQEYYAYLARLGSGTVASGIKLLAMSVRFVKKNKETFEHDLKQAQSQILAMSDTDTFLKKATTFNMSSTDQELFEELGAGDLALGVRTACRLTYEVYDMDVEVTDEDDPSRNRTVRMEDSLNVFLKKLGDGNVSAGIRMAAKLAMSLSGEV